MEVTLLGQGFKPSADNSVGNQLIKFLADKEFNRFTAISAFASQAGINGIAKYFIATKKEINIIIGVDQKGTSKEALEALLDLNVNSYIFYQPSSTIFHPKIYLFEGKNKSKLIVGSSNLTAPGLFANVETSLLVSIDNSLEEDRQMVKNLKEYYEGVFDFKDPNLTKITKKIITELVNAKIVPTEKERRAIHEKSRKEEKLATQEIISKIFPKREVAKIPNEFRTAQKLKEKREKVTGVRRRYEMSELLWESGKLKERDLTIPKSEKTNPTGSMLFKKGKLTGIDQRHYFRDEVFQDLSWTRDNRPGYSHLDRATALFRIIIMGVDYGVFRLSITHNTRTDTASYRQKNSMTSISWGKARELIARDELIGKNASLFRDGKRKEEFILVIDSDN